MICRECGGEISLEFCEEEKRKLIERQLCFHCHFWQEKIDMEDAPRVVRIEGKHYMICEERSGMPGMFRGFGGTPFTIRFNDGRETKTRNLWHQGTIPERFRGRLPDNASFVREQEVVSG